MQFTKKQIKIIKKWINNESDEKELCKKYKISYKKWSTWINSKYVKDEIKGRVEAAKKSSELLMARYLPLATAKLIEQCNSENNETSRKACIQIISLFSKDTAIDETKELENASEVEIEPEMASKILAVMAEEKRKKLQQRP